MKLKCTTCGGLFETLTTFNGHGTCSHEGSKRYDIVQDDGEPVPKVVPTPRNADECKKLLDNGWTVRLFKNALGSYTAVAKRDYRKVDTDDFEPSAALYRLTEKVFGNIV